MDKKQVAIAFAIVVVAVVAVISITMFYVPSSQDKEALAGMAYQIYNEAAGVFETVEQNVFFFGADGRQYQLAAIVQNVPDCVDTDGGADSTYAGYAAGTVSGFNVRVNDSCLSASILSEVACGNDVLADDSRNADIAAAAGLDISNSALLLGIASGPNIFNRRAKWQGRCSDLVVPPENVDAAYMGQILWDKDSQCTALGRYQCFGGDSYVCDVQGSRNVLVLNEDCAEQDSECDVDADSPTYGQCVGGQPPAGDIVLHMNFDDGTATDLSSYGNDAIVHRKVAFNYTAGYLGSAAPVFNGAEGGIFIPNDPSTQLSEFTASFRVKTTGGISGLQLSSLFSKASYPNNGFEILDGGYWYPYVIFRILPENQGIAGGAGSLIIQRPYIISDGQWHTITASFNGTAIKFYRDGVNWDRSPKAASNYVVNTNTNIVIGQFRGGGGSALIDDVYLYNRALTDTEVSELVSKPCDTPVCYSDSDCSAGEKCWNAGNCGAFCFTPNCVDNGQCSSGTCHNPNTPASCCGCLNDKYCDDEDPETLDYCIGKLDNDRCNQQAYCTSVPKENIVSYSFNSPFDPSNPIISDNSGKNNNGEVVGDTYRNWWNGVNAARFDGNGDAITINDLEPREFDLSGDFTISAWVWPNAAYVGSEECAAHSKRMIFLMDPLIDNPNNPIQRNFLQLTIYDTNSNYPDRLALKFGDVGISGVYNQETIIGGTVRTGQFVKWTHVVAVKQGQIVKLYIDGILTKEQSIEHSYSHLNDLPIRIGGLVDACQGYWYTGWIDQVDVYKRALTDDDVVSMYLSGH